MNFIYERAIIPKQRDLLNDINSAAKRLFAKLDALDPETLSISDYNKNYFGKKLKNLKFYLQFSSYMLAWSLIGSQVSYKKFHFLEYGAGSGLTSLLASEFGLNVIYNDIYEISVKDAKVIAKAIGNEALYYITGDLNYTLNFLKFHQVDCNSVVSSNVIEHIYDVKSFFRKLSLLGTHSLSVVMSSNANPYHPYLHRKFTKKQIKFEYTDRKMEYGHKERDTLKSYRNARKDIINSYLSKKNYTLNKDEIMKLVDITRGMNYLDIHKAVEQCCNTQKFPSSLPHPTNTCDPYTGSWCEQFLNPYDLAKILSNSGFTASVYAGYYGNFSGFTMKPIGKILDIIISSNILNRTSLALAPFYTIYAIKN